MYSIGELSRATGLTIKTLRFYHERQLLIPAHIDPDTGYRYYNEANLERAATIKSLRTLQFTLEEIHSILSDCQNDEDLLEHLRQRRQDVQHQIRSQQNVMQRIDEVIRAGQWNRDSSATRAAKIEVRELPSMLVGGIRMQGKYNEMGKAFGLLGRRLGRHICGKAMCLYYDDDYREENADFEPLFPIRKRVKAADISIRELPATTAFCLQHVGPYDQIGAVYANLFAHAREEGRTASIPCREVFLKGPGIIFRGNPKKYVTEVQLTVDPTTDAMG